MESKLREFWCWQIHAWRIPDQGLFPCLRVYRDAPKQLAQSSRLVSPTSGLSNHRPPQNNLQNWSTLPITNGKTHSLRQVPTFRNPPKPMVWGTHALRTPTPASPSIATQLTPGIPRRQRRRPPWQLQGHQPRHVVRAEAAKLQLLQQGAATVPGGLAEREMWSISR